jgi:hypothetical protein
LRLALAQSFVPLVERRPVYDYRGNFHCLLFTAQLPNTWKKGNTCARRLESVSHSVRHWLDVYKAAIMEFDRAKLPASIDAAESLIHQRLRGLPIANSKERRELTDALNSLAVLKRML